MFAGVVAGEQQQPDTWWAEMKRKHSPHAGQLEDLVEIGEGAISLEHIEAMADDRQLCKQVQARYPGGFFAQLLLSLTHESYSEEEARGLWEAILDHRKRMNRALEREVGISVATLDYLQNIVRELQHPKVIEENKSEFIIGSTIKDELTDLYTREVFDLVLKKSVADSSRSGRHLCLLMIDIDDFKLVNDNYGHPEGDRVLTQIGKILNRNTREMDLAARYGGEEFAVLMPNTPPDVAREVAERIRLGVVAHRFHHGHISVSVGLYGSNRRGLEPEWYIKRADQALYTAKASGKNVVIVQGDEDHHG